MSAGIYRTIGIAVKTHIGTTLITTVIPNKVKISPLKSRCITISHIGHHIVNKGQMVFDIFGGPVTPVEV